MNFRSVAVLFGLAAVLGGCGQKGPLFLPGDPDQGGIELPSTGPGDADDAGANDESPADKETPEPPREQQAADTAGSGTGSRR